MRKGRWKHTPEFKARVVLEPYKGRESINEITAKYELHPVQAGTWGRRSRLSMCRRSLSARMRSRAGMTGKSGSGSNARWVQMSMKVDWHEKKCILIGGDSRQRAQLVNQQAKLRVRRPCELLDISRSLLYCPPKGELKENLR